MDPGVGFRVISQFIVFLIRIEVGVESSRHSEGALMLWARTVANSDTPGVQPMQQERYRHTCAIPDIGKSKQRKHTGVPH